MFKRLFQDRLLELYTYRALYLDNILQLYLGTYKVF